MAEDKFAPVNDRDLEDLKNRMSHIVAADGKQFHNDFSLKRYLRAFKTTDDAFQALLKTNKWRETYGVEQLDSTKMSHLSSKARVLRHRDMFGRPVIYIPAKNHGTTNRDIDELTKFIVLILEQACKKCFEEVTDRICIVFDLANFNTGCMDLQLVQNLVWLLGKHYPERLGVCLIINAPGLFSTLWPAIRQLLGEATSQKVQFVKDDIELCKYLIPDILPMHMRNHSSSEVSKEIDRSTLDSSINKTSNLTQRFKA